MILSMFTALLITCTSRAETLWNIPMQTATMKLIKTFQAELGVFVKDTQTGITYSMNADTPWYLASAIKIFVATEAFRQAQRGKFKLTDEIVIDQSHYRDGAGQVNWQAPGQKVTVGFLIEQMMIESDNAATDLLIELLTLDSINKTAQSVTEGLSPITSMLDVRRIVFAQVHDSGARLSNFDFMDLKKIKNEKKKWKRLSEILGVPPKDFKTKNLDDAFKAFYEMNLNSGTLRGLGRVLEMLSRRTLINADVSQKLFDIMSRCETGKERLRGGFPEGVQWAHKTGTQHQRICDMGIVDNRYIVAACIKNFKTPKGADGALKAFGRIFTETVLSK